MKDMFVINKDNRGIEFLLRAFAKLRKATISFVVSVRLSFRPSAWNNSGPSGRIFTKFYI